MAGFFLYASFPNSRVKVRPPTSDANNTQIPINNQDNPILVNVAPNNANRTYVIVQNLSDEITVFYVYATTADVDPTAVATFGVTKDLLYNPVSHILYQKEDTGVTTNWAIVSIENVGNDILPLQNASLQSPQDIYAAAGQTGAAPLIDVAIDEGSG